MPQGQAVGLRVGVIVRKGNPRRLADGDLGGWAGTGVMGQTMGRYVVIGTFLTFPSTVDPLFRRVSTHIHPGRRILNPARMPVPPRSRVLQRQRLS